MLIAGHGTIMDVLGETHPVQELTRYLIWHVQEAFTERNIEHYRKVWPEP
jgi:hypothetical protein